MFLAHPSPPPVTINLQLPYCFSSAHTYHISLTQTTDRPSPGLSCQNTSWLFFSCPLSHTLTLIPPTTVLR